MIDVKALPMNFGSYSRDSKESTSFLNKGAARGISIHPDTGDIVFGTWRPVGAVIKRLKAGTTEEAILKINEALKPKKN